MNDKKRETGLVPLIPLIQVSTLQEMHAPELKRLSTRRKTIVNSSAAQKELNKLEKISTQLGKDPRKYNSMSRTQRCWRRTNKIMDTFLTSVFTTILVLLATLFALFNFDIKMLSASEHSEELFVIMNDVVFFILTIEFALLILFERKYIGSFYFYLDLLAVVSLVPDTELIMHAISSAGSDGILSTNHLVKASSASQAGARASRYLKLVRILTFIKIVRLAKVVETAKEFKINAHRKRSAIKDINYLNNFILSVRRPDENLNRKNKIKEEADINKERRFSESVDIKHFKRNNRRVSFVDIQRENSFKLKEAKLKREVTESPNEETLNEVELVEMNNENYVRYIISNHIDIFDPNEKKKEKRKSEVFNFRNPVKNELNQFLEKNAITVTELVNRQSLVVIDDHKNGRHRSILVKGFAKMLGVTSLLPATTISKIFKENEEEKKRNSKKFKKDIDIKDNIINTTQQITTNSENPVKNQIKSTLGFLSKLKKKSKFEVGPETSQPNESKKSNKSNESNSVLPANSKSQIKEENLSQQSKLRSANDSSIKSNSSFEEEDGTKNNNNLIIQRNDIVSTTENAKESDNLINIQDTDSNEKHNLINGNVHLNLLTNMDDPQTTEARPGYVKISTEDKSNSNSFKSKENNHDPDNENEAFNIKQDINLQISQETPVNLFKQIIEVNNKLNSDHEDLNHEEKENLEEKLTSLMTQKLISLIMILLVFFPIFDASYIGLFLYSNDELPSVQMYCLNSLDDAFTLALNDPTYTRVVHRIYNQCIDLAEDGSSLSKDHNISFIADNLINSNGNMTEDTHHLRLLSSTATTSDTSSHSTASFSTVAPYFYSFDFSNYENYHTLYEFIHNTTHFAFLPNVTYRHPDYYLVIELNFVNYQYFIQDYSVDDITNSTINFVYNNNATQTLQSMLNIIKVIVIGLMLVLGSYVFTDLINYYVVRPIDKVMTRLLINLKNTDTLGEETEMESLDKLDVKMAYRKALLVLGDQEDQKKFLETNKNETYELDTTLRVLINLISVSIGKPILNAIADGHDKKSIKKNKNPLINNDSFLSLNLKQEGVKYQGVILMIKFSNLDKFVSKHGVCANNYINKVYSIFHSQGLVCLGDISMCNDAIIWKEDKMKVNQDFIDYIAKLKDYNLNPNIKKEESNAKNLNNKAEEVSSSMSKNNSGNSQPEKEEETFDFNRDNVINLGFHCANKILQTLYRKVPKTMRTLKEHDVRVNLLLNYCEIYHGYIGHNLKINELYTSKPMWEGEKILTKLNTTCREPSLFFHHNFYRYLPIVLSNCIFPCEVVQVSSLGLSRVVKIFKLYFNSSNLIVDFLDSKIAIKRQDFISKRKIHMKMLSSYNNRLEEFILEEEDFEFFTLKNLPSDFINKLSTLYDELQSNKLESCIVTIRKLKKAEEYHTFADNYFKQKLEKLNKDIKAKISKNKFYTKKLNYTLQI